MLINDNVRGKNLRFYSARNDSVAHLEYRYFVELTDGTTSIGRWYHYFERGGTPSMLQHSQNSIHMAAPLVLVLKKKVHEGVNKSNLFM